MSRFSWLDRIYVALLDATAWLIPKFLSPTIAAMQRWMQHVTGRHYHSGVFMLAILLALVCLIYAFHLGIKWWAKSASSKDQQLA
jgi:hypothetical protein